MEPKIVNLISFVVPILITIAIYLLQKKTKKLSYEIILDTSLVTVNTKVKEKIKIFYENSVVTNPNFISIRFINNGNQAISKLDYEDDIVLKFEDTSKIIQCDSPKMYPDNLKLNFSYDNNSVSIKPLLLNNGEFFDLNLIIDSPSSKFKIIDRIKGLRVEKYKEPFIIANSWVFPIASLLLFAFWSYFFTPIFEHSETAKETLYKLANLPVYLFPGILLYIILIPIPDIYRFFRKRKFKNNK